MAGLDAELDAIKSAKGHYYSTKGYYQLKGDAVEKGASGNIATSFLVTLEPQGSQAGDLYCKTMTINSAGQKSGTKDGSVSEMKCW